jgi:hypothetical protein
LAFLGLHRLARLISSTIGNQEAGLTNPMKVMGQVLQQNTYKEERQQFEYIALNNKKRRHWCPLELPKAYLLCICGVQSSDGKTDHAICIVQNWIFDSNFDRALPLTIELLNICCSSCDRKTDFVRITRGHLLRARAPK